MKHSIDELNLPKDSRNSQLEVISENHFKPLFDVEKFVVKREAIDNGIDFRFEIKKNNSILGYGFNFQLKSSESTQKNQDGSYSKSIETTNIEYLLNNGQPGFYGFYIESEKTIYYVDLKKVISNLNKKDTNWQDQPNHTIRFIERLNSESINEIYNIAFQNGQMLRKINCALAENFSHIEKQDKIIIDSDNEVITDFEIITYIENNGLLLTDKCRWDIVISLHEKSTVSSNKTPKYNLILGISYYYSGEYFRALEFFKEAYKKINLLDISLQEYLLYFYYGLQRILNIISEKDYDQITNSFEKNSTMYMYRQLEIAKNLMGEIYDSEDYVSIQFEEKINEIINNPNSPKYIRVLASVELIYYKSEQLILKLIPLIEFGFTDLIESEFFAINKEYNSVLNDTKEIGSVFINHVCLTKHSRFVVHFDCIIRRRKKSDFLDQILPDILKNIEASYLYFKVINHVENELYVLTVLLEYYQNLENEEKIYEINNLLEKYKFEYANQDFNRRIDYTKNGGTFTNFIITAKEKIDKNIVEIEKMRAELIEIDKIEKESHISQYNNVNTVELFPMGYFQFPKDKIDLFFGILGIENERLKLRLKNMFDKFIPIINCYQLKIEKEGPLNGNFEYKGIESYKNMYRIRNQMFKSKFYRVELKIR